jgi:hypothetical protein
MAGSQSLGSKKSIFQSRRSLVDEAPCAPQMSFNKHRSPHLDLRPRWVLTGDEFAIFDHKRLEDTFVRDGDVAAGDL